MAPGRLLVAIFLITTTVAGSRSPSTTAANVCTIYGHVVDTRGEPVRSASVRLVVQSRDTLSTATDSLGEYRLSFPLPSEGEGQVHVSSVGFLAVTRVVRLRFGLVRLDVVCAPTPIEVRGIEVSSRSEPRDGIIRVTGQGLAHAAIQSVVPTNPLAAIRLPQLSRIGSNHSSQFRIDASAPVYLLNNIPLSADPAHFTLFSHVPSSALDHMDVSTLGTNPAVGSPAAIDFATPLKFERHRRGEFSASLVEATARFSVGTERVFSAGTIRRSVIDELGQNVNIGSSRQTIPTPTFQDVMVSSGLRITDRTAVLLDSYYSWDDLNYPIGYETGDLVRRQVLSYQRASEQYVGLSFRAKTGAVDLIATTALTDSRRLYRASAEGGSGPGDIYVDLTERRRTIRASIEGRSTVSSLQLVSGWQATWSPFISTDMSQRYWNLLSPFANSNRHYYYQRELNTLYGQYQETLRLTGYACYSSALWQYGRLSLLNGIRLEELGGLSRSTSIATRHSAGLNVGHDVSINLVTGRFYESPLSGVLESYQMPIRYALSELIPVRTTLFSTSINRSPFRLESTYQAVEE